MKKLLIFGFLSLFLFAACDLSQLSDADLKRLSDSAVVCNNPYMRVGVECCLDKDQNSICDKDEREQPERERHEEDTTEMVREGDSLVCNRPYIQVGDECCLDRNDNSICDYDDEYYAEEEAYEESDDYEEVTDSEETAEDDFEADEAYGEEITEGDEEVGEESEETEAAEEVSDEQEAESENLETCNGIDDDADGKIDEEIKSGSCSYWVDGTWGNPIRYGMSECINGQSKCTSTPTPESACDGIDNNKDGRIDEGYDNDKDGFATCKGDCSDYDATSYPGAKELCNAKDDNCNGQVDENVVPDSTSCKSAGACSGGAKADCVLGSWRCSYLAIPNVETDSSGNLKSTETRCDGIDNNCDGKIDESFPLKGVSCMNGKLGACATSGTFVCNSAGTEVVCSAPAGPSPIAEKCNDIDDDCNGQVDENNPEASGSCTRFGYSGNYRCRFGAVVCYVGVDKIGSEYCNGVDDDGNGQVDEDFPQKGKACTNRELGICATTGTYHCNFRKTDVECSATGGSHLARTEACNGVDDDCDGQVDENC